MSNERTDEFLSWRGRLDQPDVLPEQGLDNHEASWQRLAERLREKPRRRLTRYWVAAACLLLALIPAVRFLHPRPPAIALQPSARQRTLVQKVDPSLRQVRSASSDLHQPPANPPQVSAESNDILLSHTPVSSPPSRRLKNDPARYLHPAALPLAVAEVSTQAAPDSPRLIVQAPMPKKPLKVVYLNELNTGGAPSPATASRYHFSLHIGPATGGSADPPAETTGSPILKINFFSQNH